MRILKIIPGTGEGFLCENCLRDQALIAALREQGHDVVVLPIYLPMPGTPLEKPFYGAVRVYLEHRFPAFKRVPKWVKRWLDSPRVLRVAGRMCGLSSSRNLGGLTLSVLRGEHGGQAAELETVCDWLRDAREKPDVIHLSNALLLGMARRLTATLSTPIICSLQDEDTWIDALPEPTASLIWAEIRARVHDVAGFITVSHSYAQKMIARLPISPDRIRVVYPGIEFQPVPASPSLKKGWLATQEQDGVVETPPHRWHVLLDPGDLDALNLILHAFTCAKQHPSCANLHLHGSGFFRGNNTRGVAEQYAARQDVRLSPLILNAGERLAFIQSASVFTVLHRTDVAFDLSVLEAMASGIPVLLPDSGANPEILAFAEGGVLFEPGNADALAQALDTLLNVPSRAAALGQRGQHDTARQFSVARMADETSRVYHTIA